MSRFHFRNHTQNNPLIRKHVTYLVKKHLNVHSICYNVSFLIEKNFWNLTSLLHNLIYLLLLNSFLLLVLSTFTVFLKSLNYNFFSDGWLTSLFLQNFSVIINFNMYSYNLFFCIQRFLTLFMSQVFQGPGFSGSGSRVKVQGLGPGFTSSWCQSNFIEITLLHGFSHVNLLYVFRTVSHKITLKSLLLNINE